MRSGENAASRRLRRSPSAKVLTPLPGRATVVRYAPGPPLPSGMRPGFSFSLPATPPPPTARAPRSGTLLPVPRTGRRQRSRKRPRPARRPHYECGGASSTPSRRPGGRTRSPRAPLCEARQTADGRGSDPRALVIGLDNAQERALRPHGRSQQRPSLPHSSASLVSTVPRSRPSAPPPRTTPPPGGGADASTCAHPARVPPVRFGPPPGVDLVP